MNAPIRLKEPNASGRLYTFSLSFGGMAAFLTALTLSLTLFFVLGVLVGRGHRPESAVPMVAGMMPRESAARPAPEAEVLKPEELGYAEQLGKKHEGPSPARPIDKVERKAPDKKDEKKADKAPAKTDAKTDAKKEAKTEAKKDEKKDEKKPAKAGEKPAASKSEQKPDTDTRRYDYAYQAATFPDAEQAKAYLKRVKGLGLKGDIESGSAEGKAWHRVVVFFQGTPTDTRSLKEKLSGIGAQKLVMRSKTPI